MTDIEITKACAKAIGMEEAFLYDPLRFDAQNAALDDVLLKHGEYVMRNDGFFYCDHRQGRSDFIHEADMTIAANRRRARCECVAKLSEAIRRVEG